ncbi:MAG: hypothetical protein ACREMJ_04205, partial [Gemmatimonadales bacterium]
MRTAILLLLIPGLAPGVSGQTVPRTDLPRSGALRLTFDPLIETWGEQFFGGRRERLGAPLTGDTVGGARIPVVARLETDVRTASGVAGFVASLGTGRLAARQERRTTPITAEVGITDRLAVGLTLPLVRVYTRAHLALDTAGASVGLNPLLLSPDNAASYGRFFLEFGGALGQLADSIAGGSYGCPGSPACAQATAFLAEAQGVRDALGRLVYGAGTGGGAPFLPHAQSDGGLGIDANLARIQQELATTYNIAAFSSDLLLPTEPLDRAAFETALTDTVYGFGLRPFGGTPVRRRYWLGDVEVGARYRVAAGPVYAATAGVRLRLPTGHPDSPHDALDVATGDGQMDIEGQLVQELVLGGRLWLNLNARAGLQRPGERVRRVAPPDAFLVPRAATARLRWDPGDYVALDFAPLFRFSRWFAAGFTAGYVTRGEDRHTFATPQDSSALAARLSAPTAAGVLDQG